MSAIQSGEKSIQIGEINNDPEKAKKLGLYLFLNADKKFIAKKDHHILKNNILTQADIDFKISNNLIQSESNPQLYYVVANNSTYPLGYGAFNHIRACIGNILVEDCNAKFTSTNDKVVRIKNANRVYGRQTLKSRIIIGNEAIQQAQAEYNIYCDINHLKVEMPVERETNGFSKVYSIMPYIPGSSVNKTAKKYTSPKKLFQLCFDILAAYDEQIRKKDYIHRDIKSNNVKVFYNEFEDKFQVVFFDVDLAMPLEEKIENNAGNPEALPPELYHFNPKHPRVADTKIDIYGLGIMLIEMFNPNLRPDKYFYDHGNPLHVLTHLPSRNRLRQYRQNYILVNDKLFFVNHDKSISACKFTNYNDFHASLKLLMNNKGLKKLYLTKSKVSSLITKNTGHSPVSVRNFLLQQDDFLKTYGSYCPSLESQKPEDEYYHHLRDQLTAEQKNVMNKTLKGMTHVDPEQRYTLEKAMKNFKHLIQLEERKTFFHTVSTHITSLFSCRKKNNKPHQSHQFPHFNF